MPIVASDLQYRLSGGASNTDGNASLGGAKSSTQVMAGYFDNVSSAEAAAGDIEYRAIYVHNNHGSLAMLGARIWIQTNTPSAETNADIGAGTSAINGVEQTVANEGTAPSGVSFSAPTDFAGGIALGDIPAGQHKAVWVRRTVTAGAVAANDGFTLRVQSDTLP